MLSPVEGSAIAGETGTRSRGRMGEGSEPRGERARPAGLDQDVGEAAGREDRDVGERLHPAGHHDVRVAKRDLIARVRDRLTAGGAGAIEGVGGDLFRKLREEAHFASDVRHQRRRDYLPEDHLVHLRTVQVGTLEQLAGDIAGEIDGAYVLQRGP